MNPRTRLRMRAVIVASAIAATAAATSKDPSALLKPADIQALAPNAKIGIGVVLSNATAKAYFDIEMSCVNTTLARMP